jgi:hypothetical protein
MALALAAVVQLAATVGMLAAQAGDLAHRAPAAPRASHLPRPRLEDYLSPLELWCARGLAAAAVAAPLLLATAGMLPLAAGLYAGLAGVSTAAGLALTGLYGAGALGWAALQERGAVRTHFRRRLWPAAGA